VTKWGSADGGGLQASEIILIVAYSLSGTLVPGDGAPIRQLKWTRLRDSSVCLLEPVKHLYRVILPYCIIRLCSALPENDISTTAGSCFVRTLNQLTEKLDEQVYEIPPWMLWEKFGALFHACRINALQIIGKTTVPFTDICSGALINGCTEEVILRPVVVIATCEKYGIDVDELIGEVGYPERKRNWVKGDEGIGYVVINGANGEGVDIFFALPRCAKGGYVVCVDQRKRVMSSLGITQATVLLNKSDITPLCVPNSLLIKGLFNMFPWFNSNSTTIPENSFLVCFNQTQAYHGSLALHQGSSPCINVNQEGQTAIQMLLKGVSSRKVATRIIKRRQTKIFTCINELSEFLQFYEDSAKLRKGAEERILF